jgi:protein arginine N-methyltransferase 1
MLKDEVRTLSYKRAIVENPQLFKDKIVLDVGCGTGILSMFAVQAGAKHVYAVEMSDIIHQARQIVADNGFADKITLIQAKVEDMTLPVDKVDVLLSEWMGYFLLYESMLNTIIHARDKWLKPGGVMLPDKASLYLAGIEDADYKNEKVEFWNNVYGFDMKCIKQIAYREPLVDTVDSGALVTTACKFLTIDINTIKVEDLTYKRDWVIAGKRKDYMHAFIAWFDVEFTRCHKNITITTGPQHKYTHWKQTVFYLEDILQVCSGDKISGTIGCKPNAKNPRDLDIEIKYDFEGQYNTSVHKTQEFLLR